MPFFALLPIPAKTGPVVAYAQAAPFASADVPAARPSVQQTLDPLAVLPFPRAPVTAGSPYLPKGAFRSWTTKEQQVVPGMVFSTCRLVWVMAHDAPGTRVLPKASSDSDEETIGANICILGHMPVDWPGRAAALASTEAIIERAQAAGAVLKMPKEILP